MSSNSFLKNPQNVCVLGAGAWGTALAIQAQRAGNAVSLWAYLEEERHEIHQFRENKSRLPGVLVPKEITVSCDLSIAEEADLLMIVVPAQSIRPFLERLKPYLSDKTEIVFCSKGIEIETGHLLSEICEEILPGKSVGFFSGPNFAKEIAEGRPGSAVIAFEDADLAKKYSLGLSSENLRVYPSNDPRGVEMGGALKNVIAIACGMVNGAMLGENIQAALVTRGLAEMTKLAVFKGAKEETLSGLSGMGDLVLCCYSTTSRNMKFGFDVGRQSVAGGTLSKDRPLTEGAHTVKAVHKLAVQNGIDMPICEAVYQVLYGGMTLQNALHKLLMRPLPDTE